MKTNYAKKLVEVACKLWSKHFFPGKSLVRKKWSDQAEETMGDYLCGQVEIDQSASIKKAHQHILIIVKLCFWCMYDAWNFHFYFVYLCNRCIVGWRETKTTRQTEETTLRWPSCTRSAETSGLRWQKTLGMWFYLVNLVFKFEINLTPGLTLNNRHNLISDLKFNWGQTCTKGAIVLHKQGKVDKNWKQWSQK